MRRYAYRGFTLIELMIVVVIVGTLLLVAVPMYQEQMMKGRRADAMAALQNVAARQEKFMLDRSTYSINLGTIGAASTSIEEYYDLSVETPTADCPIRTCYSLVASPAAGSPQTEDSDCASFTLDSSGLKGATGSLGPDCW